MGGGAQEHTAVAGKAFRAGYCAAAVCDTLVLFSLAMPMPGTLMSSAYTCRAAAHRTLNYDARLPIPQTSCCLEARHTQACLVSCSTRLG